MTTETGYVVRCTNPETGMSTIARGGPYATKALAEKERARLAFEEGMGASKRFVPRLVFTVVSADEKETA